MLRWRSFLRERLPLRGVSVAALVLPAILSIWENDTAVCRWIAQLREAVSLRKFWVVSFNLKDLRSF